MNSFEKSVLRNHESKIKTSIRMPLSDKKSSPRVGRWYFGGISSAVAVCGTHPLDLLKVHLQTHQGKLPILPFTMKIVREQGVLALYNGISASILRQMTYSMMRFGIYAVGKDVIETDTMSGKITLASLSGAIGGFVGTPADMVNVRMQNDVKLAAEARRNYKHAIDGLFQTYQNEGFKNMFAGATTAVSRGALMTVGQLAFYDHIKALLLARSRLEDDFRTHVITSIFAGAIATTLTQPLDVLKTRAMNAKPGEFKGLWDIVKYTARLGPMGFYKGFIPAFIRLGPHTIITFVIFEQLRLKFGILPTS